MRWYYVVFLIVSLSFAGCASLDFNDPARVSEATVLVKEGVGEQSIPVLQGPDIIAGPYWTLRLQGYQEGDGRFRYEVFAEADYSTQFRPFDSWDGEDAMLLQPDIPPGILPADRKALECRGKPGVYSQKQVLPVTREFLETRQTTGIDIHFQCIDGTADFHVPGGYIKGFLKAADRSEKKNP